MKHPPLFQLTNVERRLEAFCLSIEQFEIAAEQTLVLVGPTGSGKSTLLRIVGGLERVDRGELQYQDRSLTSTEFGLDVQRSIATVPQHPILLTGTVRFNVEFGVRLRGKPIDQEMVDATLEKLGLTSLAQQSAQTLSGGETQLVAIARSLVLKPTLLLLDEPTSQLDPARLQLAENAISEVQKSGNMTIVWATHNLFQARRVGSQAAFLLNGSLIEISAIDSFFSDPTDPRTDDFVHGRMVY